MALDRSVSDEVQDGTIRQLYLTQTLTITARSALSMEGIIDTNLAPPNDICENEASMVKISSRDYVMHLVKKLEG